MYEHEEREEKPDFTFDSLKETIEKEVEEEDQEYEYEFEMPQEYELNQEDENSEEEEAYMQKEVDRVMDSSSMHKRRIELMEERMRREQVLDGSKKNDIRRS